MNLECNANYDVGDDASNVIHDRNKMLTEYVYISHAHVEFLKM